MLEQGIGGDMITLYDNGTHFQLLWTHLIPATMDGKATHNVQNAMFAAALAYINPLGIAAHQFHHTIGNQPIIKHYIGLLH